MKRKHYFHLVLMFMGTMFISSCVQGDLYDEFYEESDGWFPRKKKGKDAGFYIDPEQAKEFVENEGFYACYGECLAASLWYYCYYNNISGYSTAYDMRKAVATRAFAEYDPDLWANYYMNQVVCGGLLISYQTEKQIMSEIANLTPHNNSMTGNFSKKMIGSFDLNHFALIISYDPDYYYYERYLVLDQTGCHYIKASLLDYFYY